MPRQLPILSVEARALPGPPVVPAEYVHGGFTAAQILSVLRAHLKQSVIIALTIVVVTAVVAKLLPKSYSAQATVLFNYETNNGAAGASPELLTSYMLTQIELFQSREVLLSVIDKLGLTHDPEFTAGFSDGPATLRDWVEKGLRSSLDVEQGKGVQLLYVSATSRDRDKAALIANSVVEAYEQQERERASDPASGRAHQYSEELADLKAKVTAAQDRVSAFRQRNDITDLNAQNQADVETQALAALQQQLLQAQNQRRDAEAKGSADQSVSNNVMGSALIQNLKNQVATLQSQLAEASATLGPQHPKVLELQSQIAATRRSLNQEIQTFSSNSSTVTTTARELEDKLQRALDGQRAKVMKLRALQDEGAKLQLELDSAQTVYKRALDGYDQVMFASSSFVSRAAPPLQAAKPNKLAIVIFGAMAAILVGLGGPLGYELFFNRRLRCRDDMERDFGIPVLAEFGPIATSPSTP